MDNVEKRFFRVCGTLGLVAVFSYLLNIGNTFPFAALVLASLILIVIALVVKEKWRRKKERFFVYLYGGAEDGTVRYDENGKIFSSG